MNTDLKAFLFKESSNYKEVEAASSGKPLEDGDYEGFIEKEEFKAVIKQDGSQGYVLDLQIRVTSPEQFINQCTFKSYCLWHDVGQSFLKADLQRFNIYDDSLEKLESNIIKIKNRDFAFTRKTKPNKNKPENPYINIYINEVFDITEAKLEEQLKKDTSDI